MDNNIDADFGEVNLDRKFNGPKQFKLRSPDKKKDETLTELIIRLLPAMKSYKTTGEWCFFYKFHYGHEGNSKNPGKGRPRPFLCIEKKDRDGNILVECPKCKQMAGYKARKTARERVLLKDSGIEDTVELEAYKESKEFKAICREDVEMKQLGDWLMRHNLDKKWYMNAMDRDGNPGHLLISHKLMKDEQNGMEVVLKSVRDEGTNPFSANGGIWLRLTRTGAKLGVVDKVAPLFEKIDVNGRKADVTVPAPLTPEQRARCLEVCLDLALDVSKGKVLNAEQIQRLIDSDGDKDAVDAVFAEIEPKETAKTEKKVTAPAPAPKSEIKQETKAVTPAPAPAEPAAEDDEEALLAKQLEEARARKAAKAKAASKPAPAPTPPADEDESVEDFLRDME